MVVERLILELDTMAWQLRMGNTEAPPKFAELAQAIEAAAPGLTAEDLSALIERFEQVKLAANEARADIEERIGERRQNRRALAVFERSSRPPGKRR
jgi:aminopeptidase N